MLAAAAATGSAAHAAESAAVVPVPVEPQIGNVTYRGHIRPGRDGGPDIDDFTGRLVAGESLDVRVAATSQSGLYPSVEVIGPDGEPRNAAVRSSQFGRRLEIRGFPVDATGRWTVRVGGVLTTEGPYAVRLRVRPAPSVEVSVGADDGSGAASTDLAFEALAGSSLLLRTRWKGSASPDLVAVADPSGAEVPQASWKTSSGAGAADRTAEVRVAPLVSGDGTYRARFTAPAGHGAYRIVAEVRPPQRPRGNRKLSREEPWLAPRARTLDGAAGLRVKILGDGFSAPVPPTVYFGDTPAAEVAVDPFGTWIEVEPPAQPEGLTVRLAVVNRDGQGVAQDDFFHYVRSPVVTGVVGLDGAPLTGGTTAGGQSVRITGEHFVTGVLVRFGDGRHLIPQIRSSTLIEVVTPAHPPESVAVVVDDAYLHEVAAPTLFEFKDPPRIAADPYTPGTASSLIPTIVAMSGSGFSIDDVVLVAGAPAQTQFLSPTVLAFLVPSGAPRTLTVAVRDRVGTVVTGPSIERVAFP